MNHDITLSNGEVLRIEENRHSLSIALLDKSGDVDAYICRIGVDGVHTYPNSGNACDDLASDLSSFKPGDEVVWHDPDNGSCTKAGVVAIVDGERIVLMDGTEAHCSELTLLG